MVGPASRALRRGTGIVVPCASTAQLPSFLTLPGPTRLAGPAACPCAETNRNSNANSPGSRCCDILCAIINNLPIQTLQCLGSGRRQEGRCPGAIQLGLADGRTSSLTGSSLHQAPFPSHECGNISKHLSHETQPRSCFLLPRNGPADERSDWRRKFHPRSAASGTGRPRPQSAP